MRMRLAATTSQGVLRAKSHILVLVQILEACIFLKLRSSASYMRRERNASDMSGYVSQS